MSLHAVTSTAPPRQFMSFAADCHVKQRTWTNSTLLKGDSLAALDRMIRETIKYGDPLNHLIVGGDLFDNNRPTSADLQQVHHLLACFRNIYYIRGNHDNVNPSYLNAISPSFQEHTDAFNVYPLEGVCLDDKWAFTRYKLIDGVYVQGIPWDPSDSKFMSMLTDVIGFWHQHEQEHPDDTLYLVLHTAFKHLLAFDGAYTLDIDTIKNLCGNSRINFLVGHIHTRDTTVYNERGNYIHSPGALYPLSSDRMGQKHFASLINMVDGHIIDVPTDVRNYMRINIKDVDTDLETWLNANGGKAPKGFFPTFVTIVVPEDYEDKVIVPDTTKYVFKIERRLADIKAAAKAAGPTYSINDAIREELQNEANREMVLEMAEELLASDDPVTTLNEWLTFWGVKTAVC